MRPPLETVIQRAHLFGWQSFTAFSLASSSPYMRSKIEMDRWPRGCSAEHSPGHVVG
jgi:hypothetical protein